MDEAFSCKKLLVTYFFFFLKNRLLSSTTCSQILFFSVCHNVNSTLALNIINQRPNLEQDVFEPVLNVRPKPFCVSKVSRWAWSCGFVGVASVRKSSEAETHTELGYNSKLKFINSG